MLTSPLRGRDVNGLPVATFQCVETRLRQLLRGVTGLYDRELRRTGLRNSQFALLSALLEAGPICPTDLAATLELSVSTLSRSLRPLELAGWVEQAVGEDRRRNVVSVTRAGRRKWEEGYEYWVSAENAVAQALGKRRVAALRGMIEDALPVVAGR